jgi:hypothetical protein
MSKERELLEAFSEYIGDSMMKYKIEDFLSNLSIENGKFKIRKCSKCKFFKAEIITSYENNWNNEREKVSETDYYCTHADCDRRKYLYSWHDRSNRIPKWCPLKINEYEKNK